MTKSRNYELCWKFGSKIRFSTPPHLRRIKFGKIKKFEGCWKIWLKMRFLTTPDLQGWSLAKSGNYKFSSKIRFLTTLDLRMKFGKIQNFQSRWKFDSKFTLLTTKDLGRLKSLTTQNMRRIKVSKIQKFLVALKIWCNIWEIWPLRTCGWWIITGINNWHLYSTLRRTQRLT